MRRMEAIRKVEELAYQVDALTRENTSLRIQVCDTREQADKVAEELVNTQAELSAVMAELDAARREASEKFVKIGRLLKDNSRLLSINAILVDTINGEQPAFKNTRYAERKLDGKGEPVK